MRKKNKIISIVFICMLISLLPVSWLWRKYRDTDIKDNSKYAIGQIKKLTSSLKSGNQWLFEFKYNGKTYESYRSTHVDFSVNKDDYFLVNFSSKNPSHCKILYEYKLNDDKNNFIDTTWDTIPRSILHTSYKGD